MPIVILKQPCEFSAKFQQALDQYQVLLNGLLLQQNSLLKVLRKRDELEILRLKSSEITDDAFVQLVKLDEQLLNLPPKLFDELAKHRYTRLPKPENWWWFLDEEVKKKRRQRNLLWDFLAVTAIVVALPLVVDILTRLWSYTPDNLSVIGTVLILLITTSPFIKRGREFSEWVLSHIPYIPRKFQEEILAVSAMVALALILFSWIWVLPQLAIYYNDKGIQAIENSDLTSAQRYFQRAVALNKDFAIGYYQVANIYEEIAQPEKAVEWYQKAIENDLNLIVAYNNLGRLHLQEGNIEKAIPILQAGLLRLDSIDDEQTRILTQYRLLSHLGWAYFDQGQPEIAISYLQQAIVLEENISPAFLSAEPHYYLAFSYEAVSKPQDALTHWEYSLRYLKITDPVSWEAEIKEHLELLRTTE